MVFFILSTRKALRPSFSLLSTLCFWMFTALVSSACPNELAGLFERVHMTASRVACPTVCDQDYLLLIEGCSNAPISTSLTLKISTVPACGPSGSTCFTAPCERRICLPGNNALFSEVLTLPFTSARDRCCIEIERVNRLCVPAECERVFQSRVFALDEFDRRNSFCLDNYLCPGIRRDNCDAVFR